MDHRPAAVTLNIRDVDSGQYSCSPPQSPIKQTTDDDQISSSIITLPFMQKLFAEFLATYFLVFAGCAVLVVNAANDKVVGAVGISIVWGLVVMVMVYTVGHISGAHFNPAVTLGFSICKRFPFKEVPGYVAAQALGAVLANVTLRLIFNAKEHQAAVTIPSGSHLQSLVMEIIITFYLMFVICAVATDTRAVGQFAGLAIGATIAINAMFAGPVSGASMNPARSLGSAIVAGRYTGIWIYLLGPTIGAILGACVYETIRHKNIQSESTKAANPKD